MNELVSVSQNVTVEILEPTERRLHGLHGLHGLYGLHGLHILHGLHGLQSAFYHDISCDLAHSIKAFSQMSTQPVIDLVIKIYVDGIVLTISCKKYYVCKWSCDNNLRKLHFYLAYLATLSH